MKRHFDQLDDIFPLASKFFHNIYAEPNYNYLPRKIKKKLTKFKSAILNRHFDQFNDIFTMASIFFRIQHTQIRLKIYAGPNMNYLPLERISR